MGDWGGLDDRRQDRTPRGPKPGLPLTARTNECTWASQWRPPCGRKYRNCNLREKTFFIRFFKRF